MKKKIGLFLFALGLSASYAYAGDDYIACFESCFARYDACVAGGYGENFCGYHQSRCLAMCDGWDGNGDIP